MRGRRSRDPPNSRPRPGPQHLFVLAIDERREQQARRGGGRPHPLGDIALDLGQARAATAGAARKRSTRPSPISRHSAARRCSARRRSQAPLASSAARNRATSSHTASMPSPVSADTARTATCHSACAGRIRRIAFAYSAAARRAWSRSAPSALLIRIRSASSMMPRLMPCNSSPEAGGSTSTNISTISATVVSAWPAPTVSTSTVSNPAASHTRIASRVRRATPPVSAPAEDGRMNAAVDAAEFGHPRFVAEDRAAAALRPGIDREHRDAAPARDPVEPEALDKGRFAGARRPGNADSRGVPAGRQDRLDQPLGLQPMVGPRRFDERQRARQRPAVAAPQPRGEFRRLPAAVAKRIRSTRAQS